jgi:hypothetical protein
MRRSRPTAIRQFAVAGPHDRGGLPRHLHDAFEAAPLAQQDPFRMLGTGPMVTLLGDVGGDP